MPRELGNWGYEATKRWFWQRQDLLNTDLHHYDWTKHYTHYFCILICQGYTKHSEIDATAVR